MKDRLRLDPEAAVMESCTLDGKTIQYAVYRDIVYCGSPQDPIQKLNVFIPAAYLKNESINGYTANTAPIFMPNSVGGYMPGPAEEPGLDFKGRVNSIFRALEHGYVVVSAGVRGRTSGKESSEYFEGSSVKNGSTVTGKLCGKAPALAVDMKAAIRWVRHNADLLPGDTEKIVVSGTSAGGALAAITGASGNQEDFREYLEEIGAADERDDVFAASCYCPIHNLEHADMAYEWLFADEPVWHRTRKVRTEQGLQRMEDSGALNETQKEISARLKADFPDYLNSLELKDDEGKPLRLDEKGNGSFRDYAEKNILESAARERAGHACRDRYEQDIVEGSDVDDQTYFTEDGLDWPAFVHAITRMKAAPAFDDYLCSSPENEEFGDEEHPYQHFTRLSAEYDPEHRPVADEKIIAILNPLTYIGKKGTAPHWRIRHGVYDRDTSLAVPVILERVLKKNGIQADFRLPWGLPHSGDYDLDELFAWIDEKAKEKADGL